VLSQPHGNLTYLTAAIPPRGQTSSAVEVSSSYVYSEDGFWRKMSSFHDGFQRQMPSFHDGFWWKIAFVSFSSCKAFKFPLITVKPPKLSV
jgi:hypothetical protein